LRTSARSKMPAWCQSWRLWYSARSSPRSACPSRRPPATGGRARAGHAGCMLAGRWRRWLRQPCQGSRESAAPTAALRSALGHRPSSPEKRHAGKKVPNSAPHENANAQRKRSAHGSARVRVCVWARVCVFVGDCTDAARCAVRPPPAAAPPGLPAQRPTYFYVIITY
jgi:hypothetical protein